MKKVTLGTTDQQVSALAFGCMSLRPDTKEQGIKAILTAFELGINFFDTADVYGPADSELILGEALSEGKIAREEVVIASKCGIVFQGMNPAYTYKAYDLSPGYIKTSCEASLQRLGVDYIDLYQPHRIDYLTHPDETARALEDLRSEGKIRHVGVSNYTVDEIRAISALYAPREPADAVQLAPSGAIGNRARCCVSRKRIERSLLESTPQRRSDRQEDTSPRRLAEAARAGHRRPIKTVCRKVWHNPGSAFASVADAVARRRYSIGGHGQRRSHR